MISESQVQARYQTQLEDNVCRCELCPRHCLIKPGQYGFCLHRYNHNGTLMTAQFGRVAALAMDPVEKKPLYHFHPGSEILSVGAIGCNLSCKFCQNWQLSTGRASTRPVSPEQLAIAAGEGRSIGLAFTYNEPMIWFEYILETAKYLKQHDLAVVLVTNGYLEAEPFDELTEVVDAMNIDVKGDEQFYRDLTGGHLAPVQRNVEAAVRAGVHVEVTNLLVTNANDDESQVQELVDWLADVSSKIPLHLSRYFPQHRFHHDATPMAHMERAVSIAREKMTYVFAGNVHLTGSNDTVCGQCGATLVSRRGYAINRSGLKANGECRACGEPSAIVV